MLDLQHELKVAEEFWDFLDEENTYDQLLTTFAKTGTQLHVLKLICLKR